MRISETHPAPSSSIQLVRRRVPNRHARSEGSRGAGGICSAPRKVVHITAVGFDLYCQLLKQAVSQLKGQKFRPRLEVQTRLDFVATNEAEYVQSRSGILPLAPPVKRLEVASTLSPLPAFVPSSYVADTALRIAAYRQLAEVTTQEHLHRLARDWRDQFGKFPPAGDGCSFSPRNQGSPQPRKPTSSASKCVKIEKKKLMLTRRGEFTTCCWQISSFLGSVASNSAPSWGDSGIVEKTVNRMIRPFLFRSLPFLYLPFHRFCRGAVAADHEIVNGIAAIVNEGVITYSQVRELDPSRGVPILPPLQFRVRSSIAKIKEVRLTYAQRT